MNVNGNRPLKIALIHPDLGIGGAERLMVDAALGLQQQGNDVKIFTSHCDPTHCFEEVKDGTLKYQVFGDHLPTNLKGKFFIVCSNLRQLYLVWKLYISGQLHNYDIFIVDQLSTCVPLIHRLTDAKILFYCHFPDQLLAKRTSLWKKVYRIPFDLLEQFTISAADEIVVNSKFTREMYHQSFTFLNNEPAVIYPCVDTNTKTDNISNLDNFDKKLYNKLVGAGDRFYLSVNRYEKKKNIALALQGFALSDESTADNCKLIIVGGYDERVVENKECLEELEGEAKNFKMQFKTIKYQDIVDTIDDNKTLKELDIKTTDKVIFLTSVSSRLRDYLIQNMELLMYTPENEHFGIVPLEAMRFGKPVLASNTGGPLETIVSYRPGVDESIATGWLRPSIPLVWAKAINEYVQVKDKVDFEHNGRDRVKRLFSRNVMSDSFEESIEKIFWRTRTQYPWETALGSIYYFTLHVIVIYTFPAQTWPFWILAGYAGLLRKNYYWACYYLFIVFISSISVEEIS